MIRRYVDADKRFGATKFAHYVKTKLLAAEADMDTRSALQAELEGFIGKQHTSR